MAWLGIDEWMDGCLVGWMDKNMNKLNSKEKRELRE